VSSDALADASSYAPVVFAAPPTRVDVGDALPAAADAVTPLDAVVSRNGRFEAIATVVRGEGVLAAGADIRSGEPLRRAGERLGGVDVAVLAAAGIERVMVRAPRIRLLPMRAGHDVVLDAARDLIARAIAADGGLADRHGGLLPGPNDGAQREGGSVHASDLAAALGDASVDAVIAIGGTGSGRGDASVRTLARLGRVEVHGMALMPGETAAFGFAGARPVLLIPGRIDAALAVWLVIGRRMLTRLCARVGDQPAVSATLARKVASPLGLVEVVPVRCRGARAEPIASGYWPLQAIAQADGWIVVAADSEGYPAGAEVMVRPWP
jgi:molybdopterin molybdotransferase